MVPAAIYSGCGTPTIDGVISPDEWKNAVSVRFGALLPESMGGGTVPVEIMSMSDDKNLYVAYRLEADLAAYTQSHTVELDANHSGFPDSGDDAWLVSYWPYPAPAGTTEFFDDYRGPCLTPDGVVQDCAPMDTDPSTGFGTPGTSDGGAAVGFGGGRTTMEMWHPYHSGDARDVAAFPGDLLPLNFSIRVIDHCGDYPRCFGDSYFPGVWSYRPFLLACGAPPPKPGDDDEDVIEVRIDVKPGDPLPTISLGAGGVTAVAVHGSAAFDVARVDRATLWFAGAPVALDAGGLPRAEIADVNGDGIPDLLASFETEALKLRVGDEEASLAGRTKAGRRFHGTDAVRVIP